MRVEREEQVAHEDCLAFRVSNVLVWNTQKWRIFYRLLLGGGGLESRSSKR